MIISFLPRYLFEVIAFGGIVGIIISLLSTNTLSNANTILPIMSLYVMAGYRLMPALQQIYADVTELRFIGPALDLMFKDLNSLKPYSYDKDKSSLSLIESISNSKSKSVANSGIIFGRTNFQSPFLIAAFTNPTG